MKIGVLSDIHGNLAALQAVLTEVKRQKVTHLFVLGDMLGYYYQATEVFELLEEFEYTMIAGNHERIFLNYLEEKNEDIDVKYGNCFKFYAKTFSKELILKISSLPSEKEVEIDKIKFILTHGSPKNRDQYVYPTEDVSFLDNYSFDFILMGHTHYPMITNRKNTLVINPGSVGQSRVVGGIANWGILNTSNSIYSPQNTPYEINKTILNLKSHGENNSYLHKILFRNNQNYIKQ